MDIQRKIITKEDVWVFCQQGCMGQGVSEEMDPRVADFRRMFPLNYSPVGLYQHECLGQVQVFKEKYNRQLIKVMLKHLYLRESSQYQRVKNQLQRRIMIDNSNLLHIFDVQSKKGQFLCGQSACLQVFMEFLNYSLQRDLLGRRESSQYMTEIQLFQLCYDLMNALYQLHQNQQFHGQIRTSDILIDKQRRYRLVDRALLGHHCLQLQQQGQKLELLQGKNVFLSPSVMKCLENGRTQLNAYDPFKSDVFSAGMVILQATSLLPSLECYDLQRFVINRQVIELRLEQIERAYEGWLADLLRLILTQFDQERPTSRQIIQLLQNLGSKRLIKES